MVSKTMQTVASHPASPADLAASRRRLLAAARKVHALIAELAVGDDSSSADCAASPDLRARDMRLIVRELQMVVYGLMATEKQLACNADVGEKVAADGISQVGDAQTPERMAA